MIALAGDSPVAGATSVDDLKDYKLGAQTGTTSLTAIREDIQPSEDPLVFQGARMPPKAGAAQQPGRCDRRGPADGVPHHRRRDPQATMVGRFQQQSGTPEEFGMLFEKGNPLVACVRTRRSRPSSPTAPSTRSSRSGLSQTVNVPVLQ